MRIPVRQKERHVPVVRKLHVTEVIVARGSVVVKLLRTREAYVFNYSMVKREPNA